MTTDTKGYPWLSWPLNFVALPFMALFLAVLCEPALANKFETISGGVAGSFQLKAKFVQGILLYGGIGFLVTSVLAIIVPRTNAAFLNFANWKASAIVTAVIGTALIIFYLIY